MVIYCPICGRDIEPENKEEVVNGEGESFIYVHDDVEHSIDDIEALEHRIN